MIHAMITAAQGAALVARYNEHVKDDCQMFQDDGYLLLQEDHFQSDMEGGGCHSQEISQHDTLSGHTEFFDIEPDELTLEVIFDRDRWLPEPPAGEESRPPGKHDELVAKGTVVAVDGSGIRFSVSVGRSGFQASAEASGYNLFVAPVTGEEGIGGVSQFTIDVDLRDGKLVLPALIEHDLVTEDHVRMVEQVVDVVTQHLVEWEAAFVPDADRRHCTPEDVLTQEGLEISEFHADYAFRHNAKYPVHHGVEFGPYRRKVHQSGVAHVEFLAMPEHISPEAARAAKRAIARWELARDEIAESTSGLDALYPPPAPDASASGATG